MSRRARSSLQKSLAFWAVTKGQMEVAAAFAAAEVQSDRVYRVYCVPTLTPQSISGRLAPQVAHALRHGSNIRLLILDMSVTGYVGLGAMLDLIVILQLIRRHLPCRIQVHTPERRAAMDFLSNTGFIQALEGMCEIRLPASNRGAGGKPVQLKRIMGVASIDGSSAVKFAVGEIRRRQIKNTLHRQLNYSGREIARLASILGELCQNVPDHCQSRGVAAIVGQGEGTGSFVDIGIADPGVGVEATLRTKYASAIGDRWNGVAALDLAFQPGTSRFDGRGDGLPEVLDAVRHLKGSLVARSGGAVYLCSPDKGSRCERDAACDVLPGTQVYVRLPFRQGVQ